MRSIIRWALFVAVVASPLRAQERTPIASYDMSGTHLAIEASPDSGVFVTISDDTIAGSAWFAPARVVEWSDSLGAALWISPRRLPGSGWFRFGGPLHSANGRFRVTVTRSFETDPAGVYRFAFDGVGANDGISVDLNLTQLRHVVASMRLAAGRADPLGAAATEPIYYEFLVTKPVAVKHSGATPQWPPSLVGRRGGGSVLVQFVVDTNGVAVMSTFDVVETNDMAFAVEVWRVMPTYLFTPAELNGRRVSQWVRLPFEFVPR